VRAGVLDAITAETAMRGKMQRGMFISPAMVSLAHQQKPASLFVIPITRQGMKDHASKGKRKGKIRIAMTGFTVLTNRKRAVIALAHSVVFLGIALHGFVSPRAAVVLHGSEAALGLTLIAIYLTVAGILSWLVRISRCLAERAYFAFCASSATFGLLRIIFGDNGLPPAQYLRVLMLTCAVLLGMWILRSHSLPAGEGALSD